MTSASPHGSGRLRKTSLVLGGYLAAFVLASLAVAIRVAYDPDPDASGGMAAFADSLLFGAVFGSVGLVPTGLGLVFLRRYRLFWRSLAAVGGVVAATGAIALALFAIGRAATTPSDPSIWDLLAVLRIFPAPVFAAAFLIAGVIAPDRVSRWILFAASAVEIIVCAYAGYVWLPAFLR